MQSIVQFNLPMKKVSIRMSMVQMTLEVDTYPTKNKNPTKVPKMAYEEITIWEIHDICFWLT